MRIDWVIPCRYAEAGPNGATIVGGGIDLLQVPQFPTTISLMIAARFVGAESEMTHEHVLSMTLRDDQLGEMGTGEVSFTPGLNPLRAEGWEQGHFIAGIHQFTVERPGAYTLDMRLDDGADASRMTRQVAFRVVGPSD